MSLKPIPLEPTARREGKKSFNPGNRIKKDPSDFSLKTLCLRLIRFINRGSRFTYQQIDEIIMGLEAGILKLRKKKQEMMKKKG